jgi:DNA-binding transcriptional MocR family regulator
MELIRVLAERPVINFASGLPDPSGFPAKILQEAAAEILAEDWRGALQYGQAEGYLPLREWVAADLTSRGAPTDAKQVLIVSGSQQGIDLVARAFLGPGDAVLTEEPTYLAALQVFASFEATIRPVATDAEGVDPDAARRRSSSPASSFFTSCQTTRIPPAPRWPPTVASPCSGRCRRPASPSWPMRPTCTSATTPASRPSWPRPTRRRRS